MRHILAVETKNGICSLRFACGVILILLAALVTGQPYVKWLLEHGGTLEGPGWFAAYTYCITAGNTLLFVPIAATFASGADAEMELHSRFVLFSCSRAGKKEYLTGKAAGAALSGGGTACLAAGILLPVIRLWTGDLPALEGGAPVTEAMLILSVVLSLLRTFLNGALWALAGSLAAVVTGNHYMAFSVPFILYYVLTVFQERYYRNLFFLSPRYWAAPVSYSNFFCIGILLALCIIVSLLLMGALKRRMDYA